MPKSRRQGGTLFSVSPWQDKRGVAGAEQTTAGVVTLPLVAGALAAPAAASPQHTADAAGDVGMAQEPQAVPASRQQGAGQPAEPASAAPALAAAAAGAAASGGGSTAKRRRLEQGQEGGAEASGAAAGLADGDRLAGLVSDRGSGGAAADPGGQATRLELGGTAYLALLPNGGITGHLVCPPSISRGRRSFGVMGEVVVAGRECTRDADWGVLRMSLLSFGQGGGGELSFLAERTEGDAMRLRAPVPWQGIELEELPALDAACTCATASGLTLAFACRQLLTGGAADALLARLQPSLAGRGAVVNVGEMAVGLPPEAAAALLSAAPAGPEPGRAAGGTPQPATAPQRERLYTGGGGGSGRVVRDSGDDW